MRLRFALPLALLLTPAALAQSTLPSDYLNRTDAQVRNGGTYHVLSRTWSRGTSPIESGGADAIYRNRTGFLYFSEDTDSVEVIDEGRIPVVGGGVPGADRTEYSINGFQFTFCTTVPAAQTALEFRFYESYDPCTAPDSPLACNALSGVVNVPGQFGGRPQGEANCWTIAVDLEGYEFNLEGEGGVCAPGTNNSPVTDSFGWSFRFLEPVPASEERGMIIAGDPLNTPAATGAQLGGGSGTYYGPPGNQVGDTGLDTQDFFWIGEGGSLSAGCYFFGGAPANLFASFDMEIFAEAQEGCAGPICETCEPLPHSGGGQAHLTGELSAAGDLHLECTGGLANQFCYVLASQGLGLPGMNAFNGRLCLMGTIARYAPVTSINMGDPAFDSLGVFDASGVYQNLAGTSASGTGFDVPASLPAPLGGMTSGETVYFQLWFRDTAAGAVQGLSNVVEVML